MENWLFSVVAIIYGLFSGTLVNYLSDVLPFRFAINSLPEHRRLDRVLCKNCRQPYQWSDFIFLRNCTSCGQKRSLRGWIILLLFPIFFVGIWLYPPGRIGFWPISILLIYLALVTVIDLEHRVIFFITSYFGAVIGLGIGWSLHGLVSTLLGGIAGFTIMLGLFGLGILFTRVFNKLRRENYEEDALGYGDVMLTGVLGLLLGWPGITGGLIVSGLVAGLVSGIYIIVAKLQGNYRIFTPIPLAPFLILGTLIMFIAAWYF